MNFRILKTDRIHSSVSIKSYLIALVALVCIPKLFAHKPIIFDHFNTTNGLEVTQVFSVYQDNSGFVWFATNIGLIYFDGGSFKNTKNLSDNRVISHKDNIHAIEPFGESDDLILGTLSSAYLFKRSTFTFHELDAIRNAENPLQRWGHYRSIETDKEGNLWLGSSLGAMVLNKKLERIANYTRIASDPNSLPSNGVLNIFCDDKGRVFVHTQRGTSLFNPSNESFTPVFKNLPTTRRTNMFNDRDSNLWVSSKNGLHIFPKGNLEATPRLLCKSNGYLLNNNVSGIVQDADGSFWITDRDGGLIWISEELTETRFYLPNLFNPQTISSKSLTNIYRDKTGNIWICTLNNGIELINRNSKPFELFTLDMNKKGLFNNNIRYLYQDSEDQIWVGTKENGGLSKFNREEGTFEHYREDTSDPHSITGDYILSISELDKDRLLVGTHQNGFNIFNKQTKKFKHFPQQRNKKNGLRAASIYAFYKDKNGMVWLGSRGNLEIFNPVTETFTTVQGLVNAQWFLERNDSLVWVASDRSVLNLLNVNTREHEQYRLDSIYITHGANCLAYDSKKNLWMATKRGGIFIISYDLKTVKSIRINNGMPHNYVKSIAVDDNDIAWATTENGLVRYNPHTEKIRVFKKEDGLYGNAFENFVGLKTRNGEMYFGGSNGFNIFHPDSIKVDKSLNNVVLTDFKLLYKPVKIGSENSPLDKHISLTDKIELTHKQHVFSISFVSASYKLPHTIQYYYKLQNFDTEWIRASNDRTATYTNMPAGNYTFMVKACNRDQVYTEKVTELKIKILPPWWATWWFRIMVILVVVLLTILIYYIRLRQLLKQKRTLEKKVEERTQVINHKQELLYKQTEDLNDVNTILEERQQQLQEKSEELTVQTEILRETNNELVNLNATKDKFFSIISHDLKNPLSSIMGISKLLNERFDTLETTKVKRLIGLIDKSSINLYKLLLNLLQWAKSQSGKVEINLENVDLTDVLYNIVAILNESLKEKSLKLNIAIPPNQPVYTDKNILETVLRNFINNAIKFSENGTICVKQEVTQKNTIISVTDQGIGIPEKYAKQLFAANDMKSTKGTKGEEGTGLGLLICKELIKSCGGSIGVESKIGVGSTFYISLPNN